MKTKLIASVLVMAIVLAPLELTLNCKRELTVQVSKAEAVVQVVAVPVAIGGIALTAVVGIYILSHPVDPNQLKETVDAIYESVQGFSVDLASHFSKESIQNALVYSQSMGTAGVRLATMVAFKFLLENSYAAPVVQSIFASLNETQTLMAAKLIKGMGAISLSPQIIEHAKNTLGTFILGELSDYWLQCKRSSPLDPLQLSQFMISFALLYVTGNTSTMQTAFENAITRMAALKNSNTIPLGWQTIDKEVLATMLENTNWTNTIKNLFETMNGNGSTALQEVYRLLKQLFLNNPSTCPDTTDPFLRTAI